MLVYIAGPLTTGDTFINVRAAALAASRLMQAGHAVIVPHLFGQIEMVDPVGGDAWSVWMARCLTHLKHADCVLRLPGDSRGADDEVHFARHHGIPVYFDEQELARVTRPPAPGNPNCKHERVYSVGLWPKCASCGAWRD